MRHRFQALPGEAGRSRPVVDVVVDGLELAPQACLVDTGATDVRMGRHVADLAGIELDSTQSDEILVGGLRTTGSTVTVQLELRQGGDGHVWNPSVSFCDPWPWAFCLLGLRGLDPFLLTMNAYEEWLELEPF